MIIYLLHFDRPYRHARHYLGCTSRALGARLQEHASGNGARLVEVITQAGITWQVARTWTGPWSLEKRLKRWHNSPELCPICNPHVTAQRGYPKPSPTKGAP